MFNNGELEAMVGLFLIIFAIFVAIASISGWELVKYLHTHMHLIWK